MVWGSEEPKGIWQQLCWSRAGRWLRVWLLASLLHPNALLFPVGAVIVDIIGTGERETLLSGGFRNKSI